MSELPGITMNFNMNVIVFSL